MSFPMNDFGNTTKWLERVVGTGEIVERTLDTVKIRNNVAGDEGWLTTVDPIDVVAQGILDVEIYADRKAGITALRITTDDPARGFYLDRDVAYGVIAWYWGSAALIIADSVPADIPASLRIRIDTTVSPTVVIYYYNGTEIYRKEGISASILPYLKNVRVNVCAIATRASRTVTDTSTFTTTYAAPLQYTLTIQATAGGTTNPLQGTYTYVEGSNVEVTAIINSGYMLDHWELDGVNVGSMNPATIVMDRNHTLLVAFIEVPKHTLTVDSTPVQGVPFTIEKVS